MNSIDPPKAEPLRNPGPSDLEGTRRLIYVRALPYILFPTVFWVVAWIEWFSEERNLPRMPGLYATAAALLTVVAGLRLWNLYRRSRNRN